jgi:hypothetical protein
MHAILAMIALAVIVSLTSSTAEGRAEMALRMQPINRACTILSVIIWGALIAGWIWR